MYSMSAHGPSWPTVAHKYIRNITTRRRIIGALSFVVGLFFFWQALKSPLLKELEYRDPNRHSSPRQICIPATGDDLFASEYGQSYYEKLLNDIKALAEKGLSKGKEGLLEAIRDGEHESKVSEKGTGKYKIAVEKPLSRPQSHQSLRFSEENRLEYSGEKTEISDMSALRTSFPEYSEFAALNSMAATLPDVIFVPFEDATAEMTLTGWEDEWLSKAEYNVNQWGGLLEPKIDFIYSWVNGSDNAFIDTMYPYEANSTLNDPERKWLQSHRTNRYRDWDELRYSIRSVEKYAHNIRNKIQILVNSVGTEGIADKATPESPARITSKQTPLWLSNDEKTRDIIQIIPQEDFFDESEQGCLPTFNSLTIENQIFNTKSTIDRFFALSDDMLLGKPHAASDLYSPLFGPTMGFKMDRYNTREAPTEAQSLLFGERPYHIYTSWLLNRRFGERKRKAPVHFGHSMGRNVTGEAIQSFPRPALQSACQRFRGQSGFQLSSWYTTFHYTIERHREALLWSYIVQRSDINQNGNLGWNERKAIIAELEEGMANEGNITFRTRQFYRVHKFLENAGLEAPKVNVDILWTSLDGPSAIQGLKCQEINIKDWANECMGPGFSSDSSEKYNNKPIFSSAVIFDRVARQHPKCGDCLLKLILNRAEKGLEPLLPHADSQTEARETAIKALMRYQYTIVEPDALFVMATDSEQVEHVLTKKLLHEKREVGQLCVNDDIPMDDEHFIQKLKQTISSLYQGLVPEQSQFEKRL